MAPWKTQGLGLLNLHFSVGFWVVGIFWFFKPFFHTAHEKKVECTAGGK